MPGFLSNIDVHRVRTGNPACLPHIANVRRRQEFDPQPSRLDSGERDLKVDRLGTESRVLQLSPKRETLADENFRTGFISVAADGRSTFDLNHPIDSYRKFIHPSADKEETHHKLDFLKSGQILFLKLDSSLNDPTPSVPGRALGFDRVLVIQADLHILDLLHPHSAGPPAGGARGDEFEPLLTPRWIRAVIRDGQ